MVNDKDLENIDLKMGKVEFWFTLSQFHKVSSDAAAAVASSGGNE